MSKEEVSKLRKRLDKEHAVSVHAPARDADWDLLAAYYAGLVDGRRQAKQVYEKKVARAALKERLRR